MIRHEKQKIKNTKKCQNTIQVNKFNYTQKIFSRISTYISPLISSNVGAHSTPARSHHAQIASSRCAPSRSNREKNILNLVLLRHQLSSFYFSCSSCGASRFFKDKKCDGRRHTEFTRWERMKEIGAKSATTITTKKHHQCGTEEDDTRMRRE